jgi:flagellar assembly protein FliH
MSSSSEAARQWTPMQYREDAEGGAATGAQVESSQADAAAKEPTVEEQVATRVAEERRALTEASRRELTHEVQVARNRVAQAVSDFRSQREHYFSSVEQEVVQLALAIARRILHRESQIDQRLLGALVQHELEQLESGTTVRLCVPPEETASWMEMAATMPRTVEVISDRAVSAGCVRMETKLGSTVVDFENELKEIERGFFDLLAHRPPVPTEDTPAARVQ